MHTYVLYWGLEKIKLPSLYIYRAEHDSLIFTNEL